VSGRAKPLAWIAAAALAMSMAGVAATPPGSAGRLPALDAVTLDGHRVRNADLADRPTLVSFFFAACVPCIREAPVLNAFAARHPEIHVLAVTPDPPDVARGFVTARRFTWPVVAGAREFIAAAHVRGYPTWLLVSRDGRILARDTGLDEAALREPAIALAELERWVSARTR
jgi:thiol-disulfide isomerase/thioredoxin